jgi:hypothetical protein
MRDSRNPQPHRWSIWRRVYFITLVQKTEFGAFNDRLAERLERLLFANGLVRFRGDERIA